MICTLEAVWTAEITGSHAKEVKASLTMVAAASLKMMVVDSLKPCCQLTSATFA